MSDRKLEFSRGEVIASKYEVVDLLDESPLGLTYRVKHLNTGKYVRLTMLHPDVASRERKNQIIEAFKQAKDIQHDNLLKVGELGEHEGVAYYTSEDFEGKTLRELIQEYKIAGKQFALKEAAQVVMQILEALSHAHDKGFIFRAVRPEYVLVHVRWTGPRRANFVAKVKVIGMGFWSLVDTATLAEDEFTRGEAQYLAPELKSFEPTPTARSDIYSASVIFYEMLVGTAPIGTFQLPRTRRPELPEHVNDVVELGIAQAPEDRYQTARDFIIDIQRTFDSAVVGDVQRRPLITPIGWGIALVAVILVAVILYNFRTDPIKEAEAADSMIRKTVQEGHIKPTPGEVMKILENHPDNMIYIPAGPYVSGRLNIEFDAHSSEPLAEVRPVNAFLIDAFEYPNKKGAAPRYRVSHTEASRLCKEQGKRLCTADEWEKACKGPRNFIYSYGDTYDESFCGAGVSDEPYTAGAKQACKSGWGVYDLSGNFREWTNTDVGKPTRRIVKGGSVNAVKGYRCAFSTDQAVGFIDVSLSFRCCRDLNAPPAPPPKPEPEQPTD